ncbi:glycoside hydrolase family 3 C-terminal domain-containing protein [Flammeovirga yaeyamensis]|uniref:beta-glucosidase n=1 Tax=Flammeovirga yaeyamensis TaxID=367791 RepID=A0AAX1NA01_9BACT|nr:glycoside hydrolase family 3 N-terminal domain-containing protein [Flammeovirga yaeyamensis]MBB3699313.1 beta-glucosidase [Flammeovirga yaeyamensis]NMF35425.1 hypothetical protein [Flammeovirga yaeyamensis]QWG04285.1 glycoside hydrolase family 3 C-terminal domain-containing protein [Flammeovirga yaeyamensis]
MKKYFFYLLGSLLFLACQEKQQANDSSPKDLNLVKADSVLSLMTLEEKLGQLQQHYVPQIDSLVELEVKKGNVGSILNGRTSFYSVQERNKLQKIAVENSRLGIPILFAHDVIHGYETTFPINLAQSCSWNKELVFKASQVAAKEAAHAGIDWAFAPMVDVSRDARWGRISECYGEDPYLNALFGEAVISGYQGDLQHKDQQVIACLKHYVGYGAAEGGRDYQYTEISKQTLHDTYLPPFEYGITAGALSVMSAFNDISGTPASANPYTLNKVLKDDYNFEGVVVSDWDAVTELILHGSAEDSISAALLALNSGVDMEMKSRSYEQIAQLKLSENLHRKIDQAVKRVLYIKFKSGLFDQPYVDEHQIITKEEKQQFRALVRQSARESMVLLKNSHHLLPIKKDKYKSIAILGPFAEEKELMGWWKSVGDAKNVISPLEGIQNVGINVTTKLQPQTDLIILCLGEQADEFGENNSKINIELAVDQQKILEKLSKTGVEIVTVIFNGRPLALQKELDNSDALLLAWHPGAEAGNALADLLFGDYNPSGRLTTTFPKSTNQIPMYYNHRNSGRPQHDNYKTQHGKPLFPFGFGMSYSEIKYGNPKSVKTEYQKDDSIEITCQIENVSDLSSKETVQLYVQDPVASITQPIRRLIDFKQVDLKAKSAEEVRFSIKKDQLSFWNQNSRNKVFEPGEFIFHIGPNSRDTQSISLLITSANPSQ